jgi:hypothetical protein
LLAYGPVSSSLCATTLPPLPSGSPKVVDDPGSSNFQYNATTFTWQYNWQPPKSTVAGCYLLYIKSQTTGQVHGGFGVTLFK